MKNKKLIGLSLTLFGLVLMYVGTYAYYMRVVNGTITGKTGAFTFDVLHNNKTFTSIDLYDTITGTSSIESSDKVIVPGDKGSFVLTATGVGSSSDIEYTIMFNGSSTPSNMKFYLDEAKTKVLDVETNKIYGYLDKNGSMVKEHTIYWEWPYDSGRYNDLDYEYANKNISIDVKVEGKQSKDGMLVYGVKRNTSATSTAWERVGDSIGLEANAVLPASSTTVADTGVVNDFDNIYPWSEIRSYNYNANTRKVTAWYGEANFKFDGSNGEVLTYIPGFYYKREVVDGVEYQYISKYEQEGYSYSEPFSVGRYKMSKKTTSTSVSSTEEGRIELMAAAPPCDDKCKADRVINVTSSSGSAPLTGETATMLRESASKLGTDFSMMDYHYFTIWMLYLIEYADYNLDLKLIGDNNYRRNNNYVVGGTDSLGMKSGYSESNNISYAIYRGVEGFFIESEAIDGINIKDNYAYVNYDFTTYYFDKYDGNYAVVNYSLYDENAKGIALGYDSSNSLISILQTNEAITGGGYILCGLGDFGNYNGNSSGSRLVRHQSNIGREFGVPQGENWN